MIRDASAADAARICEIYNDYVARSIATFEVEPVSARTMAERIAQVRERFPWIVLERDGQLAGYAYAAPWKARTAYRYTVESSVYVAEARRRSGVGDALMRRLLEQLRVRRVHAVLAGIALPNDPCVALHEKLGFRQVAHFRETGRKFGRWIDVGYWQRVLTAAH